MLTIAQRERILSHLKRGWKLPDSLVHELWEAYEALERAQTGAARPAATYQVAGRTAPAAAHEQEPIEAQA